MPKGMFTELMELADDNAKAAKPDSPATAKPEPKRDDGLPKELEDLSIAGYNSHSFRFTESEMRWIRRFCLLASERLDRQISRNTLVRSLLRLAHDEWTSDPHSNRLLDLLTRLKI